MQVFMFFKLFRKIFVFFLIFNYSDTTCYVKDISVPIVMSSSSAVPPPGL